MFFRIDEDPPFIGGKEGGNPTSNRCGIPYFLKSNTKLDRYSFTYINVYKAKKINSSIPKTLIFLPISVEPWPPVTPRDPLLLLLPLLILILNGVTMCF